MGTTTLAAGVVVPTSFAILFIVLGCLVAVGIIVVLILHPQLHRRIGAIEAEQREGKERYRQIVALLQENSSDMRNVKDLLHTLIKGHINNG